MSRTLDFIIVYRILKLLNTKWTNWDAFKLGIIDRNGEKLRDVESNQDKEAWTPVIRLVWHLKLLIHKIGGDNQLSTIITSLLLIKDSLQMSEEDFINTLNEEDIKFPNNSKAIILLEMGRAIGNTYGYKHGNTTFIMTAHSKDRQNQRINPEDAWIVDYMFTQISREIETKDLRTSQYYLFYSKSQKRGMIVYLDNNNQAKIITILPKNKQFAKQGTEKVIIEHYEDIEIDYIELE